MGLSLSVQSLSWQARHASWGTKQMTTLDTQSGNKEQQMLGLIALFFFSPWDGATIFRIGLSCSVILSWKHTYRLTQSYESKSHKIDNDEPP